MASPIFSTNNQVIVNAAMTGTVRSSVIDIAELSGFAVHSIFTGAPVGSHVIEGSNDGINFSPVDTTAVSAAGQIFKNFDHQHYRFLRVSYIFTSGTGSLTTYVSSKAI